MVAEREFYDRFYSLLSSKIQQGVYNVPGFTGGALVFNNPGIIIDPNVDWKIPNIRHRFSAIMDYVIDPSFVNYNAYGTNYVRLSSLYNGIMTFRNFYEFELSEAEKVVFETARGTLYEGADFITKTARHTEYNRLNLIALQAQIGYQSLANTPNPDMAELQTRRLAWSLAAQETQDFDSVHGISRAKNDLRRMAWRSGRGYWDSLENRARAFLVPDPAGIGLAGTLYQTEFYPQISSLLTANTKWTKITLTESEILSTAKSKMTSLSASGGFRAGFFGARANYSETTKSINEKNEVTGLTVDLEYTYVFIDRPWLDITVFGNRAWNWDNSTTPWLEDRFHNGLISNGANPNNGEQPVGISPFIPTALIVAKNTKFTGNWELNIRDYYERHVSASASVSYFGLSLGGKYNMDETSEFKKANVTNTSLEFPDPQIIGMTCVPLSKSPDWDEDSYGPEPGSSVELMMNAKEPQGLVSPHFL